MPKDDKKDWQTREDRMQTALKDLREGRFASVSKAAEAHNLPRLTLSKRFRGVHSSATVGHAYRQKLSAAVESVLVHQQKPHWTTECYVAVSSPGSTR